MLKIRMILQLSSGKLRIFRKLREPIHFVYTPIVTLRVLLVSFHRKYPDCSGSFAYRAPAIIELLKIRGLGLKRANTLYHDPNVQMIEQLYRVTRDAAGWKSATC